MIAATRSGRGPPSASTRTANRGPRHEAESLIREISGRHPAAGLAIGVVRDACLEPFYGHGRADVVLTLVNPPS